MLNKEKCFQTQNEVMLDVVLDSYEEDLVLSGQRLDIFKVQDDMETFALELPYYTKTLFKIKQIKQLIEEEKQGYSSHPVTITAQIKDWDNPEMYTAVSVADRF